MRSERWTIGLVLVTVWASFLSCAKKPEKPRFLWIDALANWEAISSPGVIDRIVDNARKAGFTGLIVDVKPITGEVMYPSKVATRLTEWRGAVSPGGYDYVDAFVRLAHEYGLKAFASVNVFAGGHRRFKKGIVYSGHGDWQCVAYTPSGLVKYTDLPQTETIFLQPSRQAVQKLNLEVLDEIVRHYPVDGVVLDRVYYPDLTCDFSEASRQAFERFLGRRVERWPEDVFRYDGQRRVEGPLYRDWLFFRSKVLHDFLREARRVVKQVKPQAKFCLYAGAWLPLTMDTGLNWVAANSPLTRLWPDTSFRRTSVRDLFDGLFAGLYYASVSSAEVPQSVPPRLRGWYSIEDAADSVRVAIGPDTPVYGGLLVEYFSKDAKRLRKATQVCLSKLDGVMIFDLVYVEKYQLWDELRTALRTK